MLDKSSFSLAEMTVQWREQGLVAEADVAGIEAYAAAYTYPSAQPVAVRVLSAIGASIAMFCLLGFLSAVGLLKLSSPYYAFVYGWILVVCAIIAHHKSNGCTSTRVQIFVQQSALCLMLAGKLLLVYSLMKFMPWLSLLEVSAALFMVSIVTYPFYKVYLDRFLSMAVCFATLLLGLDYDGTQMNSNEFWFLAVFIAQLVCAYFLFTARSLKSFLVPVRQALIIGLTFAVLWISWDTHFVPSVSYSKGGLLCLTLCLAVATGALIMHFAPNRAFLLTRPLVFAFPVLALLGVFGNPAWLFTLFLLVLGYGRQEKYLTRLGLALLPVTLFLFYYNLNITLLEKSVLLTGSGIILLALCGYLYTVQRTMRQDGAV